LQLLSSGTLEQPLRSSLNRVTNQHLRMSYNTRRSHGGFNKGSPIQKPVEVGKQYEVDVIEISRKGDGIAKIQGFVIFVENGKVGNKIKVEINEVADRFAKATIVV
jgi:predicted RNA-binding protein with TRAM domain